LGTIAEGCVIDPEGVEGHGCGWMIEGKRGKGKGERGRGKGERGRGDIE
jgi:hypothetical protein